MFIIIHKNIIWNVLYILINRLKNKIMKNIYNLQKYFYIFKSYYMILFYYHNIILLFFICKELINLNYIL